MALNHLEAAKRKGPGLFLSLLASASLISFSYETSWAQKALSESALSRGGGRGEFRHPLLFPPEENGLRLIAPQLNWDIGDGQSITMNNMKIDSASIGMYFTPTKKGGIFSFAWPQELTTSGTISLLDKDGKSLWEEEITEESLKQWQASIKRQKNASATHGKSQWGVLEFDSAVLKKLVESGSFRYCINKESSEGGTLKICSQMMTLAEQNKRRTLQPASTTLSTAVVVLGGTQVGIRGVVTFPDKFSAQVTFANQSSLELTSQPIDLQLLDAVESRDGKEIVLTGQGRKPLGKVKTLSSEQTYIWAHRLVKQESVWQVALPRSTPTLQVRGDFNMPFTLLFDFQSLPKETDRVFVHDAPSGGTYAANPVLIGITSTGAKVSSKEFAAKKISKQQFEWTFAAPKKGEENRARLIIQDRTGKNSWTTSHSLYRGYANELSGRLSGVATESSLVPLGEIAGSTWFDTIGSWQSDLLSRQRWGLAGRYFRALTTLNAGPSLVLTDFSAINLDLKYTFMRGLWNKDQLLGLAFSFQDVTLGDVKASLFGTGFYWARTMPKFFDDLFNLLPFMEYPKYVDMELILYPMTITSGVTAGMSYNLNFHGKVFWLPRFYGEAGFGLKNFVVDSQTANSKVDLQLVYGTAGLGFIF